MINVTFSKNKLTIKNQKRTPPQRKEIEGVDGNIYKVLVPDSTKTTVAFEHTHKGALAKNDLPDEIKNNFSETECGLILEKQKKVIQKALAKSIQTSVEQIDSILYCKDFIEGGQDAELLANKIKELQNALKKKTAGNG